MSTKVVSDFQRWINESRDAAAMTTRCAVDGCPWLHVGSAGEGREAARDHRREAHPDLPVVPSRPKPKPKPAPKPAPKVARAPRAPRAVAKPRRPPPNRRMTPERAAAVREIYLLGWTVAMIGELVAGLWQYATPKSATISCLDALHALETPMRPRGKRSPLPEIGRAEAEAIARRAG